MSNWTPVQGAIDRANALRGFIVAIGGLAIATSVASSAPGEVSLEGPIIIVRSPVFLLAGALAVLLFPAAVLSLHLAAHVRPTSPVGRALIGSVSWAGWYLLAGAAVVVGGTFGLWPEGFVALLVLVALAGAAFSLLAVRGQRAPPGPFTTGAASVGGILLIVACFVTAGWWGAAVR